MLNLRVPQLNIDLYLRETQVNECILSKIKVLIHCVAGVSRSAALVIAFIMKERGLTLEDAFNEVKSRRKTVKSKDM